MAELVASLYRNGPRGRRLVSATARADVGSIVLHRGAYGRWAVVASWFDRRHSQLRPDLSRNTRQCRVSGFVQSVFLLPGLTSSLPILSPGGRTAQCSAAVFKRVSMRVVIMRVVIAGAVAGRESVRTRVLMPKRSAESASFRKAAARPTKIPSRKHYFSDYYFKCTTFN